MRPDNLTEAELSHLTEQLEAFARELPPSERAYLRSALAQAAPYEEVAAYAYDDAFGPKSVRPLLSAPFPAAGITDSEHRVTPPRPPVFRLG